MTKLITKPIRLVISPNLDHNLLYQVLDVDSPAKGVKPLVESPLKMERPGLSGGGTGGIPRTNTSPLLLQEKGGSVMRYQSPGLVIFD